MPVHIESSKSGYCRLTISDPSGCDDMGDFFRKMSFCQTINVSLSDLTDLGREGLAFYLRFRIQALKKGIEIQVEK